ncbi:ribonuclease HIII [Terribacillus saccharophilus]|uniref:Ribonuclease HIII n=1 Tax=Terribacillus saccharophilus TaxID=361277 RepID=A0A268H9M7_9BACI|nr:ribonuclease HIII [Terribacillus saccharophilus]PAE06582.1 ribonuclease HIII [Terribacillus saccharophilus]
MGQIVLQLPLDTIQQMKATYSRAEKPAPPGAIFSAKTPSCSITAYKSGKVLFQGKSPETEADKWGSAPSGPKKPPGPKAGVKDHTHPGHKGPAGLKPSVNDHRYAPAPALFTSSHIGSDEAGTGDFFGPITVASVYVDQSQFALLKELGVKDSKLLKDDAIQRIAKDLMQVELPYSLLVMRNERYNQLQQRGWSQGKMKTMLHHHAIQKLLAKIDPTKPDGILIDQFQLPSTYIKHLATEGEKLQQNVSFMTKAESHSLAVAAASIISRASFVREMDKLSKQAGFTIPKGASAAVDQAAGRLIRTHGRQALPVFTKMHFANSAKAEKFV